MLLTISYCKKYIFECTDSVQACNSDPARTRLCSASSTGLHCSTDKNETWR